MKSITLLDRSMFCTTTREENNIEDMDGKLDQWTVITEVSFDMQRILLTYIDEVLLPSVDDRK